MKLRNKAIKGTSSKQYWFCFAAVLSLLIVSCTWPRHITGNKGERHFLLRDEGMSQLAYINLADSTKNWYVPVPAGRDIQLVGNGRVLIGTGTGYEEREITAGKKVFELTSFGGTIAARRLKNGNTLLTSLKEKEGILLTEVDKSGAAIRTIFYPGFDYVRLIRETAKETFLVTANNLVFEGDANGKIIWKANITGHNAAHAWQAVRLQNGNTVVSSGFAANFQIFSPDGNPVSTISGPADVRPHFYAGFQVLPNGNYVVTNWQGHGPAFGASGVQLLEYNAAGSLVWSWKQDSAKISSLQGVVVLDGLDVNLLHTEDGRGVLAPVR